MHSPRKKKYESFSLSGVCVSRSTLPEKTLEKKRAYHARKRRARPSSRTTSSDALSFSLSKRWRALRAFEKDHHHRKTTFEKRGVLNRLSRLGERFENADDDEARRRRQSRRQSRLTFFALLLDAGAVSAGRGGISVFARSLCAFEHRDGAQTRLDGPWSWWWWWSLESTTFVFRCRGVLEETTIIKERRRRL